MRFRIAFIVASSALLFTFVAQGAPPPKDAKAMKEGLPPPTFTLKPVVKGTAPPHKYTQAQLARGEAHIRMGGCNDCHTPMMFDAQSGVWVPQMNRMLSGHPEGAPDPQSKLAAGDQLVVGPTFTSFVLPFGVVYAANLTPDTETGSGGWTEEAFFRIFRTGKHLGGSGRPILPPMPWASLAKASDEDLRSVFAYLRSIPPVKNKVPDPKVPEPVFQMVNKVNSMMLMAP